MDSLPQFLAGMLAIYAVLFIGIFMLYFVLLFFLGLMFYYFTGDKAPGVRLLNTLMRGITRVYSESWMLLASFTGLMGLAMLFKVLIGALFPEFTYATSSYGSTFGYDPKQADLQIGLVMFIISVLIFAVHWGLSYVVETKEERRGTIMTKMFAGTGLMISSFFVFGILFAFVMELISYAQTGSSTYGAKPGASLATLMAAFPVWAYYMVRTVWMVRREEK